MRTIANRGRPGNPLPFGAVPHEIVTDPRLEPRTDCAVVARLLFHAQWDDQTDVSDSTIAKALDISRWTVQRALKRLAEAGWIRRRQVPKTGQNQTGRVILLCWKLPDFEAARKCDRGNGSGECISVEAVAPVLQPLLQGCYNGCSTDATQHRVVVVEGEENKTPQTPHSNDNDPDPGPSVLAFPMADEPHRELVEDLGGSLADAVDLATRPDEDAEAAKPAPRVYPMTRPDPPASGELAARAACGDIAHLPPDWAEALLLASDEVATAGSKRHDDGLISDPADAYTATQLEWLASLTEAQRARFDELSPGRKREVIAPHTHRLCTDPAHATEAARSLAPRPRSATVRAMPETLEGMWGTLPGAPATWPPRVAEMMRRHFGTAEDERLWPAFHALALAVWRGEFSPDGVLDALRQANKPGVRNRGALFNHALQRDHGWRWS